MITLNPIGKVDSPFKEKFGIPKQSQMTELISDIKIEKHIPMESFDSLENMGHIWIIFYFHLNSQSTKASVRPPLLGGNKKVGIYSSRSSFRHNNLGLSLVRLLEIDFENRVLKVMGLDCCDGTPVIDIKPYHPVADIPVGEVELGWIEETKNVEMLAVEFAINIEQNLKDEIVQFLKYNPRPSYQHDEKRIYGIHYKNFNILWKIKDTHTIVVIKLEKI